MRISTQLGLYGRVAMKPKNGWRPCVTDRLVECHSPPAFPIRKAQSGASQYCYFDIRFPLTLSIYIFFVLLLLLLLLLLLSLLPSCPAAAAAAAVGAIKGGEIRRSSSGCLVLRCHLIRPAGRCSTFRRRQSEATAGESQTRSVSHPPFRAAGMPVAIARHDRSQPGETHDRKTLEIEFSWFMKFYQWHDAHSQYCRSWLKFTDTRGSWPEVLDAEEAS